LLKNEERSFAMRVQDIMTEAVKACGPDTNLAEAAAAMWEADCGTIPVVADGEKVIGMVTDRDIAVALGTRDSRASDIAVSDVMSEEVYACHPEDDIHTALKAMRKDKVRRLPVIDNDGVLQGILSINDVALHAEKFDEHRTVDLTYEDVVNTLKTICEHRHPKGVTTPSRKTAAL
jgi:CBS domain-containing protein